MSAKTHRQAGKKDEAARTEHGTISIGEMAAEFGVTLRTLRFYENRGLLKPRRVGLSRLYSERDCERLTAILRGKQLGFTLSEIADMLRDGRTQVNALKLSVEQVEEQIGYLERQKVEIEAAIDELMVTKSSLEPVPQRKFVGSRTAKAPPRAGTSRAK